mmetsp:Transcript_5398/g.11905  ORF Transcript_5398/g.11905 Transcript_5398/m.11905 type:complete len:259 (+) Transcript_5398:620-1396(+)
MALRARAASKPDMRTQPPSECTVASVSPRDSISPREKYLNSARPDTCFARFTPLLSATALLPSPAPTALSAAPAPSVPAILLSALMLRSTLLASTPACCIATCAVAGSPPPAQSPSAKTSSCVSLCSVREVRMRPCRSLGRASPLTRAPCCVPAVNSTRSAGRNRSPRASSRRRPVASTALTEVLRQVVTPQRFSDLRATLRLCAGEEGMRASLRSTMVTHTRPSPPCSPLWSATLLPLFSPVPHRSRATLVATSTPL